MYIRQMSRTDRNQDFDRSCDVVRKYLPILLRILFGNRVIIEKRESCFKWRRATAGRDPAKKKTTGSGVLWFNLSKFCRVVL